jgi:hypothetical protein
MLVFLAGILRAISTPLQCHRHSKFACQWPQLLSIYAPTLSKLYNRRCHMVLISITRSKVTQHFSESKIDATTYVLRSCQSLPHFSRRPKFRDIILRDNREPTTDGYLHSLQHSDNPLNQRKQTRSVATNLYQDMALDPNFAVQAFTLIAGICAAKFTDHALDTCGRIDGGSKTVVYYSCGVSSTSAAMFAFPTAYGLYIIYQNIRQTPVTPGTNDTKA